MVVIGCRFGRGDFLLRESMKGLQVGGRSWSFEERKKMLVEGDLVSGDEDLGSVGDAVTKDLLITSYPDEDALR